MRALQFRKGLVVTSPTSLSFWICIRRLTEMDEGGGSNQAHNRGCHLTGNTKPQNSVMKVAGHRSRESKMQTRRMVVVSLAGIAAAIGSASVAGAADDGLPKPKVLPGKPLILDYGEGVKVPCDKGAFLTLWEGSTFWLTFGVGISPQSERAKGLAVHHAVGAMRYLLLTLAFAPDRLKKVEGNGWRQKVENPSNYVLGELELPGHPGMPMTDAFMGFGNADQHNLAVVAGVGGFGGPNDMPGAYGSGPTDFNSAMMLNKVNAFCDYVVKKKDMSLADVRKRATNVQL